MALLVLPFLNYTTILYKNTLLKNGAYVGIATHDVRLTNRVKEEILPGLEDYSRFEFQALLGVSSQSRLKALRDGGYDEGYKVRLYLPFGTDWYAYSLRRCKESPQLAGRIALSTLMNKNSRDPI